MFEFLKKQQTTSTDLAVPSETLLIAGLGNPGRQYSKNRHNIGFMVLDRLAERLGARFARVQFRALVTDAYHQGSKVILAKPQTYMNDSGLAVASLARFYKIPLENLLIVHEDQDLAYGSIRLRPGGSSPGQKGVSSIIDRLGSQDFPRLRLGIGRPPGQMAAAAYVLQDFDREEAEALPGFIDTAVEAVLARISQGLDKAMNIYNTKA